MIIYAIKNLINNKVYIGQTRKSFNRRYPRGIEKSSHNEHLKSALRKYGKNNFAIEILIKCSDLNALNYWEKYYIGLFKSYNPYFGYNKTLGGYNYNISEQMRNNKSKIVSTYIQNNPKELIRLNKINHDYWNTEESRKLKSEQMKKICSSKIKRLHMAIIQGAKPFRVFKKDTNEYVGEWLNKSMCAEELDIDSRKVCACLNKSRRSHKGYVFQYN